MIFADRFDAGRRLASPLEECGGHADLLVLALPRGGVPVGYEIAMHLKAPLDILVVRKLGAPGQPELALGAIASGGLRVLNEDVLKSFALLPEDVDAIALREQAELERRERKYRGNRPPIDPEGRLTILVDDGWATGSSMLVAAKTLRRRRPAQIVVAVPVAPPQIRPALSEEVDSVICLETPSRFHAVSEWYREFGEVTDDEVQNLLQRASSFTSGS